MAPLAAGVSLRFLGDASPDAPALQPLRDSGDGRDEAAEFHDVQPSAAGLQGAVGMAPLTAGMFLSPLEEISAPLCGAPATEDGTVVLYCPRPPAAELLGAVSTAAVTAEVFCCPREEATSDALAVLQRRGVRPPAAGLLRAVGTAPLAARVSHRLQESVPALLRR